MQSQPVLGASYHPDGTLFRVWAFGHESVAVTIEGEGTHDLAPEGDGYFAVRLPNVQPGAQYRYSIDGGPLLPDLASRWQSNGTDGPSSVVAGDFAWTDTGWPGVERTDQVAYELHIGTFTQAGTWQAAIERLADLKDLGVTVLQIMPISAFKGRFGWGYDTVLPYSPFAPYGTPDDVRAFVDAAHANGLGVILDVVYNHVGLGDHYRDYSDHYFTKEYEAEWGASFNFDGEQSAAVRNFIVSNAVYWIKDFHFDGLRVDAVQALFDQSPEHILTEVTKAIRAAAAPRKVYVMVENQPQQKVMIEPPEAGGYGVDTMMNDDFHHAAHVALTGHSDFYYRDYLGTPQELISALKYGFLYQGQRSDMRDAAYGTYNLDTAPEHFVHFLENHDQVANSARGFRLSSLGTPARVRAVTSLLLLGPQTPCLFQGQEFAASNPFLYFLGLDGQEAEDTAEGRRKSLTNFPSVADPAMQAILPRPDDENSFTSSKLDWSERDRHAGMWKLHRDLLALRKSTPAFSQRAGRKIDGAVIGEAALVLRFIMSDPKDHRLLLVNLGRDLNIGVVAEPLLGPCAGHRWTAGWSSEHPDYNGTGRRPTDPARYWTLPGDSALLLVSEPSQ